MTTTTAHLESATQTLNAILKQADTPRKKRKRNGRYGWNIGHFMIDSSYGGYKLVRISNDTGGVRDISSGGYIRKSQLWDQINAMINLQLEMKRK